MIDYQKEPENMEEALFMIDKLKEFIKSKNLNTSKLEKSEIGVFNSHV